MWLRVWPQTPPPFLDWSQQNPARKICLSQGSSLWCRNFKIRNGCHGNMKMQTLRPQLTVKGKDLVARAPDAAYDIDLQIFWPSHIGPFFICFHSNSKKLISGCRMGLEVAYILKCTNEKYLQSLFIQKLKFQPIWTLLPSKNSVC